MVDHLLVMRLDFALNIAFVRRNGFYLDLHLVRNLARIVARHPHPQHIGFRLTQR